MEVGAIARSCPIDHKFPQFPHVFFVDDNRVQTGSDFVHEEGLVDKLIDVFADRSPEQVDILGIDKLFEHNFDLIFLLSYFGIQELEHLLDHEFEVVLFTFHYLYYLVYILGSTLVNLLHYLRNDFHHTRNHLPLVNLKHELHPVESSFRRHRSFLLGKGFLQQRHNLDDVYGLLLVDFVDTLLQDLVDIDGLSPHLLLLVGHQQQDGLQDLIEPLDHYLLEIQFLGGFGDSYLDLVPEKHEKEFKPLKSLKFRIAGTFRLGDLDQYGHDFIYEVDTHVLLKAVIIKFLFYGKLEVTKALVDIVLDLHVAYHQQQVLENFSHMHDEVQVQKLVYPADQIFSHLQV
jgi:hypothetical protein